MPNDVSSNWDQQQVQRHLHLSKALLLIPGWWDANVALLSQFCNRCSTICICPKSSCFYLTGETQMLPFYHSFATGAAPSASVQGEKLSCLLPGWRDTSVALPSPSGDPTRARPTYLNPITQLAKTRTLLSNQNYQTESNCLTSSARH